ncbi:TPA: hypothetical protein RRM73_001121 [Staphylococcus argenteus]|nr:hypothetical protein [Staphylococcus argenteus]MBE2130661.1 hypothetical protein [Staphylococcus argenteus]HDY9428665.1 hypothetical protein [Staphylococcus argenteus]HDY9437461.1 hypothetical protein [Staphylococcus argenteus]HDY9443298.1 hypothetical protein [Staphylococcus argenteus]
MQVGVGPNTEAGGKSAYNNVQVGGPQQREFQKDKETFFSLEISISYA